MLSLALRGLASRKLRAALTALAIMLGVAMVAGTFMLKGSVDKAFDDIFAEANAGVDVTVQPKSAFDSGFDLPSPVRRCRRPLVEKVAAVDGVEKASAASPTRPRSRSSTRTAIGSVPPAAARRRSRRASSPSRSTRSPGSRARRPATDDEVGIDSITADEEGYEVGQKITISGVRGAKDYTLCGDRAVRLRRAARRRQLRRSSPSRRRSAITGKEGELDNIDVEAVRRGHARTSCRRGSTRILPSDAEAKTGAEDAAQQSADIKDGFGFLTTFLLVFAGISVFVGAFLIFNTFSITVAQRTREFGMLRTLGASSRQVLATVFTEAMVLGILASILGIVAGLGFVALVTTLFKAMGFELPQSGIVITPASVIVPMIVGIVATLGSSIVPALRATRVTPLEALREGAGTPEPPSRRRIWIARALVLIGIVALAGGLFATSSFGSALPLLGLGLILLFVGVAMLAGTLICPARLPGRQADRAAARRDRPPRPREHPAQPEPDGHDLGGADDRGRAGRLRGGLRLLGDEVRRRRSRRDLLGRPDRSPTPTASRRSRPTSLARWGRSTASTTVSPISGAPAEVELCDARSRRSSPASTRRPSRRSPSSTGSTAIDATLTGLGADQAIVESKWAEDNGVSVGDTVTLMTADR